MNKKRNAVVAERALRAADRIAVSARLNAAGIAAPRAESVLIDLANDPPLGHSARAIAVEDADRVALGIGAAMAATGARRGCIAVRDESAASALRAALLAVKAERVAVERVADAWPSVGLDRDLGCRHAWVLDGERLLDVEAAAFARPRAPRRITIAGDVAVQQVVSVAAPISVEELVARAGGLTVDADAWVALDGGIYGGVLADREADVCASLVVILPAAHALVARARLSIGEQLLRAASACEGCRVCTEVCPIDLDGTSLEPHALINLLVANRDPDSQSASSVACIGCDVCTSACPASLAPGAIVGHLKQRFVELSPSLPSPKRGPPHPDRATRRTSIELLLLRAGQLTAEAPL